MVSKSSKKNWLRQACVLAAPLILVGCSSVPDAVNPVEWYRSSVDFFSDDETAEQKETQEAEQTASDAPAEVAPVPAPEKQIEEGFVAPSSSQRQYAEPVIRQNDVVSPLGEATVVATEQAPAPIPAPNPEVTLSEPQASTPQAEQPASQPVRTVTAPTQPSSPARPTTRQSLNEIYAANLAQNRPHNMDRSGMQDPRTMSFGGMEFDTVVVSSGGVTRQTGETYNRPVQTASLGSSQFDVGSTYVAGMAIDPQIVRNGQAQSLQSHNQALFNGSFQVATIQFQNGSSNLTSEDRRILQEVVNIHLQQGGVVRVVGHASSRTRNMSTEEHVRVNLQMSLLRADTVGRELLGLGVSGERLFVGGVSDSQPIYQEVMPSGEAGNRRTEIYIDY